MPDFNARHMIEALRSGIPSRAVGEYFSSSRGELRSRISKVLDETADKSKSTSLVITGRYGEGKTHILNTAMNMALKKDMVVSLLPLSKETPASDMNLLYKKLLANTWLPGRSQPGIENELEAITASSDVADQMLEFAKSGRLDSDRLYFVFRAFLGSNDTDEHYVMLEDLMGSLAAVPVIKQTYERSVREKMIQERRFYKRKNAFDYFTFTSRLFTTLGYSGWLILFDEAELIGRLGRQSRKKAYLNLHRFLFPSYNNSICAITAFSTSFYDEVIEKRNEEEYIISSPSDSDEDKEKMLAVIERINYAEELKPITDEELLRSIEKIIGLYEKAYDWKCPAGAEELKARVEGSGFLLRTVIRACIEVLDQLFLYGDVSEISAREVAKEDTSEELEAMLDDLTAKD